MAVTVFLADLVPLGGYWWRPVVPWPNHPFTIGLEPKQLIAVFIIFGLAIINISGVGKAGRFQS